jgi:hypothetical protein
MPKALLQCEVLQPCFVTGSSISINPQTQEVIRTPLTDRRVDAGQLVEVAEGHPLESEIVGQHLRVIRTIEIPDEGLPPPVFETEAERIAKVAAGQSGVVTKGRSKYARTGAQAREGAGLRTRPFCR